MKSRLLAVALLSVSIAAAHHSFEAEYDRNKSVTLTGTVTKIDWQNPHVFFFVDVATSAGAVEHWALQAFAPGQLVREGWVKDESLKPGDKITVTGWRARNGEKLAHSREVTLASGRKLFSGGPPDATGGN